MYNNNCLDGCCSYYRSICDRSYCEPDLYWLWWSLGCFFFLMCICSICLRAKRRRMMMEAHQAAIRREAAEAAAREAERHRHHDDVVIAQIHYQQQPVYYGQPV